MKATIKIEKIVQEEDILSDARVYQILVRVNGMDTNATEVAQILSDAARDGALVISQASIIPPPIAELTRRQEKMQVALEHQRNINAREIERRLVYALDKPTAEDDLVASW